MKPIINIKKNNSLYNLALVTALTFMVQDSQAAVTFISPTSISTSSGNVFGVPGDLIDDATDANYLRPNPSSGGGGTAWFVDENGSSGVTVDLTLDISLLSGPNRQLTEILLWDYTAFTPTSLRIEIYDGGTDASQLALTQDFTFTPNSNAVAGAHQISLNDHTLSSSTVLARLITLEDRNPGGDPTSFATSESRGVGYSEIAFNADVALVPEPSSLALFSLSGLALLGRRKR